MKKSTRFGKSVSVYTTIGSLILGCSAQEQVKMRSGTVKSISGSQEGDAVAKSPSVSTDGSIDQVKRDALDSSATLQALLDQERDERIKEDQRINERITKLEERVTGLANLLDSEIRRLDAKDREIEDKLLKATSRLDVDIQSAMSTLRTETDGKVATLNGDLTAAKDAFAKKQQELQNLIADYKSKNDSRAAETEKELADLKVKHAADVADLNASINRLQEDTNSKLARLDSAHTAALNALKVQLTNLIDQNAKEDVAREAKFRADLLDLNVKTERQKTELSQQMTRQILKLTEMMNVSFEILQENMDSLDRFTAQRLEGLLAGQVRSEANLRAALSNLKSSMEWELSSKVAMLDSNQKIAASMLTAQYRALEQAQKEENEFQKLMIAKTTEELNAKLAAQKEELQGAMEADKRLLTELLERSLNEVEAKLSASNIVTAAKIRGLAEEQKAFRDFVLNNYATKTELKVVRDYAEGVKMVTEILGKKMDQNDEDTRKLISDSVLQMQADTNAQIYRIEASVAGLRMQMLGQIAGLNIKMDGLSSQMQASVADARRQMLIMRGDLLGQQAKFKEDMMKNMAEKVAEFEFTMQATRQGIADQLLRLDARIDKTDASVADAYAEAQRSLGEAMAKEQAERAKMQASLQSLTDELEKVAQLARRTQALTDANQAAIRVLRSDFETEKTNTATRFKVAKEDLDKNVAALRDEMKKGLEDVSNRAARMVANLGQDVQDQFRRNAVEMAEINQRQNAAIAATRQMISEVNSRLDIQEEMEAAIAGPREQSINALIEAIGAITEVETSFVAALNPDQNNPPFYNEFFKPIMAKCGGNPQATFANALGYDSFQFLAQEYVRQLMFGSRGNPYDAIFYGQPTLLPNDNLPRLTGLAATRNTLGGNEETCITEIQTWARQILFGTDSNTTALRALIVANQNLARSVLKLRNAANALNAPMLKLEELIGKSVKDQMDAIVIINGQGGNPGLLVRYAMTLLEAANTAMMAKERALTFERIVAVQESFAKENAQVRDLVNTNKTELQKQIDAFKISNAQQITAVQSQLKSLDTAMKRALDVMMTIASRAGYQDVQAEVLKAAEPLGYKPFTISEVKPAISEIQHFFLAPSLASTSNACTGASVQSGAGVRTYYQHGGWGPCWVNFRQFPLAEWYGRTNNLFFRVFGAASTIKVDTQGFARQYDLDKCGTLQTLSTNTAGGCIVKAGDKAQGVFDLISEGAFTWYLNNSRSWDGVVFNFTATSQSSANTASRSYRVQLFSPLILDFIGTGRPKSISVNDSHARFDLQANGVVTRHGWVAGDEAGFLALDTKGDRMIRDGSQLFGESMKLANGSRAKNGYHALAQYDRNKDNVIDHRDSVFKDLVVWFDMNADGISDASEVKTLAEVGVTNLGLDYKEVAKDQQIQAGNRFQYEAKFWGPDQCPAAGCGSYDVFFSTSTNFMAHK